MRHILVLLQASFSFFLFSQDSAKVLFIGNSYTFYNDLPQMVTDLAASQGDYVYHDDQLAGGATFTTHANNAATYVKIGLEDWDYVVLQAQSQEPSFPDSQVDANTLPPAVQISDSIYANYFCSEPLFFMTWGRENGDPQWQPISTYEGMQARLRNAYMRFADSVQGSVSPVGMAWKRVRDNHPGIQLYVADGSHPSLEGSYLAACTFYASIFRKPSTGSTYFNGVDPIVAAQLQAAADFVVLDSLDQWNLRDISEHTQADFNYTISGANLEVDFENVSTKAQTYLWDFGDGQTSTAQHPVHTYLNEGLFTVTLTAMSPCDTDVITTDVNVTLAGIEEEENVSVVIKTTQNGYFELSSNAEILEIIVLDPTGKKVQASKDGKVDLSEMSVGMYLIQVSTSQGHRTLKVVR